MDICKTNSLAFDSTLRFPSSGKGKRIFPWDRWSRVSCLETNYTMQCIEKEGVRMGVRSLQVGLIG